VLRAVSDAAAMQQQEGEAQRLFEQKRFSEAATIWARLADRETDKRGRSILRSKEREARRQEHEAKIGELRARAQAAVGRGDFKGALAQLEQGRELHRDSAASSASSSVSDVQLERDIAALRQRLAWRRRVAQIAIAAVLVIGGVVVFFGFRQGWFRPATASASATPTSPAAPATVP
jgi:hypothetical protein